MCWNSLKKKTTPKTKTCFQRVQTWNISVLAGHLRCRLIPANPSLSGMFHDSSPPPPPPAGIPCAPQRRTRPRSVTGTPRRKKLPGSWLFAKCQVAIIAARRALFRRRLTGMRVLNWHRRSCGSGEKGGVRSCRVIEWGARESHRCVYVDNV